MCVTTSLMYIFTQVLAHACAQSQLQEMSLGPDGKCTAQDKPQHQNLTIRDTLCKVVITWVPPTMERVPLAARMHSYHYKTHKTNHNTHILTQTLPGIVQTNHAN